MGIINRFLLFVLMIGLAVLAVLMLLLCMHMGEIARLAGASGITEGQLIEMYRVLQEENR